MICLRLIVFKEISVQPLLEASEDQWAYDDINEFLLQHIILFFPISIRVAPIVFFSGIYIASSIKFCRSISLCELETDVPYL